MNGGRARSSSRGCPATAQPRLPGVRAALVTFACRAGLPDADRCGTGRATSGERLRSRLAAFLREHSRTSRWPDLDPNDRHYARVLEQEINRLGPRELDRLMREFDDDD